MSHRTLTDIERAERRQADRDRLEQAARTLLSSDGWQRWVKVRSTNGLARNSFGNQLLIAMQRVAAHCLLRLDGEAEGGCTLPPSAGRGRHWVQGYRDHPWRRATCGARRCERLSRSGAWTSSNGICARTRAGLAAALS